MIYYVGHPVKNSGLFFTTSTFEEFDKWINQQLIYQIDTETSVTNSIVERKLKLIQFGDSRGKQQWVIQPSALTQSQALRLVEILNNPLPIKIAHFSSFEYQILKKYGVILSNIYDTHLCEKVLWCGYSVEPGFYSLAGLYKRYLFKELDKELQTSFDVDIFSVEQIFYAAQDVTSLGGIRRMQIDALKSANLLNVAALENEAVCAFAEIEYNGMRLDLEKWRANIDLADPVIEEAARKLDEFLRDNQFRNKAVELGYLTDKDSLNINWNSTLQKKLAFSYLFPTLEGITQPFIKKYIKNEKLLQSEAESSSTSRLNLLEAYLLKDYSLLEHELLTNHKEFLISNQLLVLADTSTINWQSTTQRLDIFKIIAPKLKSTSKQDLSEVEHPIVDAYQEYINATKLKTSFGEEFINKFVDSDGKVRTHFNQILNTGRVSSSAPNLQNIPAKGKIGTRYRNAFIADEGWLVCSSDYASQELILIAYFSQDKVWLDALSKNKDLHSTVAEIVYKDKWRDGTQEGCRFYYAYTDEKTGESFPANSNHKCSCKKHKELRELIKTINYMLCYGGGASKFSAVAKISLQEAKDIIKEYFEAFPGIKGILDAFAAYGVRNGFIMSARPYNRRRYFDYWEANQHDNKLMSQISRASQNSPLQSSASDQMKTAMCLMYWYIKDNNLWDKVKLVSVIHDECVSHVREEFAEEWVVIMNNCMEEATTLTLPKGLLKADTGLSGKSWSK